MYPGWPTPSTIISDGAGSVGGFPGDPRTPETLAEWYDGRDTYPGGAVLTYNDAADIADATLRRIAELEK